MKRTINDIPSELLAPIFSMGILTKEEEDAEENMIFRRDVGDEAVAPSEPSEQSHSIASILTSALDEEDDSANDEEPPSLPFQVLVSHVCQRWRDIALSQASLWVRIKFEYPLSLEKSVAYLTRARSLPFDIYIDTTITYCYNEDQHPQNASQPWTHDMEDPYPTEVSPLEVEAKIHGILDKEPSFLSRVELVQILDFVMPHVAQWRLFHVFTNANSYMYIMMRRLAGGGPATSLEELQLSNYGICAASEPAMTYVPFGGICPRLLQVVLRGVRPDWEGCRGLLSGLRGLELANHYNSVRPSLRVFRDIITNCPQLQNLHFSSSGPALGEESDEDTRWDDDTPIKIASLNKLVLHDLPQTDSMTIVQHLDLPNIRSLILNLKDEDYSSLAYELTQPEPSSSRSILSSVESLKLRLPCSNLAAQAMLGQLYGLHDFLFNDPERVFYQNLLRMHDNGKGVLYCPMLESLSIRGISGAKMISFVETRRRGGSPLRKVHLCTADKVTDSDIVWLRKNVDIFTLEFFGDLWEGEEGRRMRIVLYC